MSTNSISSAAPAGTATSEVISTQNAAKLAAEAQTGVRDGDEAPGVGKKVNTSA
jgi:hypothetical protein